MDSPHLGDVQTFVIPGTIVDQTWAALRHHGRLGQEARVLWSGQYASRREYRVVRHIFPTQECSAIDTVVDHEELLRVALSTYQRRETLAVQLHTHPGRAFHSSIDDEYPLIRELGCLSIVVPNYATRDPGDLSHCAVFRLRPESWEGPLSLKKTRELLIVEREAS